MLTSLELPKHRTKEEYAFSVLRTAILNCELKPGEKLVVDALSAQMGISPIPIRTALQRLQSEGLVEITPHTGAIVSDLSPSDFEPVSLLLERLEVLAFQVAAQKATETDITHLRQIATGLDEALASSDLERWAELNIEFHRSVANITNMKLLIEFSNRILDTWTRLRRWYLPPIIAQLPQAQAEHWKMIELLNQRDLENLDHVVIAHSQRLREYAHQATANLPSSASEKESVYGK